MSVKADEKAFKDGHEAAYRRLMRGAVRKASFTKGERDVVLAVLNVWFHHRNGPKKFIHPSRDQIARKSGVSIKTVSRALDLLRTCGALVVISDLRGGKSMATRYRVDDLSLLALCGLDIGQINAAMGGKKPSPKRFQSGTFCTSPKRFESGTKCPTVLNDVAPLFEGDSSTFSNVIPMPSRRGAK